MFGAILVWIEIEYKKKKRFTPIVKHRSQEEMSQERVGICWVFSSTEVEVEKPQM